MTPLELVGLTPLVARSAGRSQVRIGLIDGPVAMSHPELASEHIQQIATNGSDACARADSAACVHGTFVAGVLVAKRGSIAPAICPGCSLLVRPIFTATREQNNDTPCATPEDLAQAILECIDEGAKVLNVSAALAQPSVRNDRPIEAALVYAAKRGVIIVVAAGNQGSIGSTALIRHTWVIPVVAFDLKRKPLSDSNFGSSIGRRGLGAPGDRITSLGSTGKQITLGGTSAATPFVTGAIALLWSEFPNITATRLKFAIARANLLDRTTVVPPLLDAWRAYNYLLATNQGDD